MNRLRKAVVTVAGVAGITAGVAAYNHETGASAPTRNELEGRIALTSGRLAVSQQSFNTYMNALPADCAANIGGHLDPEDPMVGWGVMSAASFCPNPMVTFIVASELYSDFEGDLVAFHDATTDLEVRNAQDFSVQNG